MKGKDGEIGRPNYATIHRMIENPIYGGTYLSKTAVAAGHDAAGVNARKPRSEWLVLMPNAHRAMLAGRRPRRSARW